MGTLTLILGWGGNQGPEVVQTRSVVIGQAADEGVEGLRPEKDVDVREAFLEGLVPGADHAAHERDGLVRIPAFEGLEGVEPACDLVLDALPDYAAVEDYNVGVLDVG